MEIDLMLPDDRGRVKFTLDNVLVISGANGSGKSTLAKAIYEKYGYYCGTDYGNVYLGHVIPFITLTSYSEEFAVLKHLQDSISLLKGKATLY